MFLSSVIADVLAAELAKITSDIWTLAIAFIIVLIIAAIIIRIGKFMLRKIAENLKK